jgi:hypothetical protein
MVDVNYTARYENCIDYETLYVDVVSGAGGADHTTAILMKSSWERKWHFVQSCDFEQIEGVYAFLKKKKVRFRKIV